MIDPLTDDLIPVAEIGERYPNLAIVSPRKWWRFAKDGKLETVRIGRSYMTTADALRDFIAKQSGSKEQPPASRTPRQRNKAAEAAMRELEDSGA